MLFTADVTSEGDLRAFVDRLAEAARPAADSVVLMQRLDSTHACSLRLIEQAETEEMEIPPTLIVASRQDQGVGRFGRSWASPEGGLYLSWVACGIDPTVIPTLPMVAAAAASEAVDRLGVVGATIKWPNDLLVGGRKLAGVLIHTRQGNSTWVSVGLGINLERVPDLSDGVPATITTVSEHIHPVDPRGWSVELVRVFVAELISGIADPNASIALWRDRLQHREGDEMTVRLADGATSRGRFAGVTDEGHLLLEADGAVTEYPSADVIE